jgi:hypothetical protein
MSLASLEGASPRQDSKLFVPNSSSIVYKSNRFKKSYICLMMVPRGCK